MSVLAENGSSRRYPSREGSRPEVRSKGKPIAGREIRRKLEAAKEAIRECRVSLACPAASLVCGDGPDGMIVRCGIERSHVTERTDPSSLLSYCLGDYTLCSTWRAEKERTWAGQAPLVGENEGL